MPAPLRTHLEPHLRRLGELAGGRLDELAELADKHPPELRARIHAAFKLDVNEYQGYRSLQLIVEHLEQA